MLCKNCQHILPSVAGMNICPNCGAPLMGAGSLHADVLNTHQPEPLVQTVHHQKKHASSVIKNFFNSKKSQLNWKIAAPLAVFLLLFIVGGVLIFQQNQSASALLKQAESKIVQEKYQEALSDLQKADSLFVIGGLDKKIKNTTAKNNAWIKNSSDLKKANALVEQGKLDEADTLLRKISKDYPSYSRVAALRTSILEKKAFAAKQVVEKSAETKPVAKKAVPKKTSTKKDNAPSSFTAPASASSSCYEVGGIASRSTTDRPDDSSDYQFHVIYALPSDGADRAYDTNGRLAASVSAFQSWLCGKTGGKYLKIDKYQGKLDVSFVRLASTDQTIKTGVELPWAVDPNYNPYVYNDVESRIISLGFNQPNKIYLVYYDGSSNYACGGASWPPGIPGIAAMMYLRGDMCLGLEPTSNPLVTGYWEFAMLHDALHSLGLAPSCAPHITATSHVSDGNNDLMWTGPLPWMPSELDNGNDDYYNHNIPNCPDLADSIYLQGGGNALRP